MICKQIYKKHMNMWTHEVFYIHCISIIAMKINEYDNKK